jgi:hypothetical protein
MSDTPETDQCVKENKHLRFLQEDNHVGDNKTTYENPIVSLSRKLERERDRALADLEFRRDLYKLQSERLEGIERERDEAVRSCHIWQEGHAELVRLNQPERKHIGRWGSGSNKELFTSPYINR